MLSWYAYVVRKNCVTERLQLIAERHAHDFLSTSYLNYFPPPFAFMPSLRLYASAIVHIISYTAPQTHRFENFPSVNNRRIAVLVLRKDVLAFLGLLFFARETEVNREQVKELRAHSRSLEKRKSVFERLLSLSPALPNIFHNFCFWSSPFHIW